MVALRGEVKHLGSLIFIGAGLLFLATIIFWAVNNSYFENSLDSLNIKNNQKFNTYNIVMEMDSPGLFHPFTYTVDNNILTSKVRYEKGRAILNIEGLKEGRHNIKICSDVNIYSMAPHEKSVYFDIDTTKPVIEVTYPESTILSNTDIEIIGKSKPNTEITFNLPDKETIKTTSSSTGYFSKTITLAQGNNDLLIKAIDPAGNENEKQMTIQVDNIPPEFKGHTPLNNEIIKENYVTLSSIVTDEISGMDRVEIIIDNKKIPAVFSGTNSIAAELNDLDEGEYKVTVIAYDKAGGQTKEEWNFTVDSSETFGERAIRFGARGKDVEQLQKSLVSLGYLDKKKITSLYDEETLKAVTTYEKDKNMEVTERLDHKKLLAFCNKIRVYLDEFKLFLLSPTDKIIKSFPIACGSYSWPTPTGNYYITDKQMYPTWYPPPSPWAKDLKPIPPGPGNPLGTRWMGLSGPGIGIHGTPSEWSIGYPDSHGCLRMYIADAEELFDRVQVGTPVDIYATRPGDHVFSNPSEPDEKIKQASQIIEKNTTNL